MNKYLIYWYSIKAKIKFGILLQFFTALRFAKITWLALWGKIIIVESKKCTSNGGYKYLEIIISKRPLLKNHIYEGI